MCAHMFQPKLFSDLSGADCSTAVRHVKPP